MQMDACFRPPDLVCLYKQSVELIFQLGATAEEETKSTVKGAQMVK